MDTKLLLNKQDCLQQLKEWDIDVILHEHEPTPTMAELQHVKLSENTAYVKNLFYVDKKVSIFLYQNNYYMVIANHQTQIGKLFWKTLGLSSGNMRLSKPEQILEIVQSKVGHVNPFALINDQKDLVKFVVFDTQLQNFTRLGFHPIENTATVEITLEDLQQKFLKRIKKEYQVVNLTDEAAQQIIQEAPKAPEEPLQQLAITVKKSENFSKWYQQVITKSEMIEYYDVSGCYILRPWAYSIWERMQNFFNELIQAEGVENSYFPMFLSAKHLNKEKEHVEGFKAEVAWVTKYGESDLAEPLAIRPTSETIMYPAYAKWITSHRDLPLKLNQWTNIVRWEFKFPTPFIRTREFLWQEGHTAHSTREEAVEQVYTILNFYERVYKDMLAVPVIKGIKTESEKFAGGDFTTTVETIIPQNGRGLQAATSHHLGQNFSKMFDITFEDVKKQKQHAWQTSWGLTTRSLGAMIMIHGDDKGLILPPRAARFQVVIIPIVSKDVDNQHLEDRANEVKKLLTAQGVRATTDFRDIYSPGWKYNHWEQKGVPLRFEVGPKDYANNEVRVVQRLDGKKYQLKLDELNKVVAILEDLHEQLFTRAKEAIHNRIKKAENWKEFMGELNKQNTILTKWCQREECEQQVKKQSGIESKEQDQVEDGQVQLTGAAKTLCMPLEQEPIKEGELCFHCGQQAKKYVLWGRSY